MDRIAAVTGVRHAGRSSLEACEAGIESFRDVTLRHG